MKNVFSLVLLTAALFAMLMMPGLDQISDNPQISPVQDLSAAWTITTNRIGSYSSEYTIVSDGTNDTFTNYTRHKGLMKSRVAPLWYFITCVSNNASDPASSGSDHFMIPAINKTNFIIRRSVFNPAVWPNPSAYLKVRLVIMQPYSTIK